jgi:SH3 domain protein
MRLIFLSLTACTLLLTLALTAYAETRYISDQLVVTVRSNKTNNYEVLATLITASPVEILEEDNTYVKVRTEKGVEGYIRKQYVSKAVPKTIQIAELKRQKDALEAKLAKQQQEFQDASGLATSSQTAISNLTAELEQARKELEQVTADYTNLQQRAENVINLTAERDQLLEDNSRISSELMVLQEENRNFHRSNMIQWFLAGGGVFFVGWLAGKISRKKRGYGRF